MALINFSPNPNGCSCDITGSGGGPLEGNETHNFTYNIEKWRYDDTPMPHWEPDGSVSESVNIRTKSGIHFDRWGAVMTGNLDQQPLDGHTFFTSIYLVKGWTGSEIKTIQFDGDVWDIPNATGQATNTNAQGESTTSTFTVLGYRFNNSSVGWNNIKASLTIDPDCLVFETESDLDDYLRTGDSSKAINTPIPEPVEQDDYDYFISNVITSTVGAGADYSYFFRFKMNTNERLAMYKKSDGTPYDRVLKGLSGVASTYKGDYYGQEVYEEYSSNPQTQYLGAIKKLDNGTTWTPITYETNIPTFDTEAHADAYILSGDETGIIDKWRTDDVVPGEIGDPADTTPQGENGMIYTYGSRMYRLSNLQLFHFYDEVFDPTPATVQAILDGLQLFGANQINAIQDVMYLPFDASLVASMSAATSIKLGTYTMQAQGEPIQKNDKLINMGTVYFPAPYGARDFRNYEPNCKLYIMLPYAGTHELQISKYIGKNVTLKMACDVSTGQATYFLYAGGCIMDSFDCIVGVHRPITAVDHAQHTAQAMNAIMQTGQSAISTLAQGATAVTPAKAATKTREATPTQFNASFVGGAVNTIMSGYQAMNVYNDAPMTPRGSFTGGTGLFDVKSPYFVFAQLKPQMPSNLAYIMGRPSSAGGLVSSFSGFLQTCAFSLADGFTGTEEEAAEIYSLMEGGIYVD